MVMQSELSEYAHHLESLLDQVRSGVVGCTSELVSTLLKANDCIIGFIKKIRGEGEVDEDLKQTTLKELKSYSNPLRGVTFAIAKAPAPHSSGSKIA